jgi:hypothetical protein
LLADIRGVGKQTSRENRPACRKHAAEPACDGRSANADRLVIVAKRDLSEQCAVEAAHLGLRLCADLGAEELIAGREPVGGNKAARHTERAG